jgi:hypothetical protein
MVTDALSAEIWIDSAWHNSLDSVVRPAQAIRLQIHGQSELPADLKSKQRIQAFIEFDEPEHDAVPNEHQKLVNGFGHGETEIH